MLLNVNRDFDWRSEFFPNKKSAQLGPDDKSRAAYG